ncbi:MAG TPA: GNAT family N-acetyltransferase [Mycobacteriales bacterium]|nr:GNAT family N-acetyltransferase [Mycobacteriales bacterium]
MPAIRDDVIPTERLMLRPWRHDDLDAYFDIYSRPEVMHWLGTARQPLASREEAVERLAGRAAPDPEGAPYGVWAVCEAGTDLPLGSVLLRLLPWSATLRPVPGAQDPEIGWHLHPDVWGRGYATEAAGAILDRAWAHGLTEVHAVTYPDNVRSQAVCRRLGMTHLGRTDRYYDAELELFRLAQRPKRSASSAAGATSSWS